jgi:hypothetical protein
VVSVFLKDEAMSQNSVKLKLFAGNSNPALAQEIGEYLKVPLVRRLTLTCRISE